MKFQCLGLNLSLLFRNICSGLIALIFTGVSLQAMSSNETPLPIHKLAKQSNAIYVAEVANIVYKNSLPVKDQKEQAFTFVTYKIIETLRGAPKQQITLRFWGGVQEDGTVMTISNYPALDKGDRDVLFVKGNGKYGCPLTQCTQGRFRLIKGNVYSEEGRPLLRTEESKDVDYGRVQALTDIANQSFEHPKTGKIVTVTTRGSKKEIFPLEPNAFSEKQFISFLEKLVVKLPKPNKEELDINPYTPFYSYNLRTKAPHYFPVPLPEPPEISADELEKWDFERNGGNPVLP